MVRTHIFLSLFAISLAGRAYASPAAAPDNIVSVNGTSSFCMIMPKLEHTNIGTSEQPGGTTTFCSRDAHYSASQGTFPDNFWKSMEYKSEAGKNGKAYAQLTGCINPNAAGFNQLNAADDGGQYDSSGGADKHGNPVGSICLGYNHYVELVEPAGSRVCIRCCNDPADCPTHKDTQGCPNVIPGNYFDCV
ncbi:hypothetical protein C8F01DRAFT_1218923 [Mycena amicta]|nr:hypothetical protein C8F01DRAFT_1218923 [Mycena amicta]